MAVATPSTRRQIAPGRRGSRRAYVLLLTASAAAPGLLSHEARANKFWINSVTSGSWSSAADWDASSATGAGGAGAPGSSDNVYLTNTTNSSFTIVLNENDTIFQFEIGSSGGGVDTFSQTSVFSLITTGGEVVGYPGTGIVNQSAGTDSIGTSGSQADLTVGDNVGYSGTYNLSGSGSLTTTHWEIVGEYGVGSFNQSGGTNTVNQYLVIGNGSTGTGTYTLNGAGTLNVISNEYVGNIGNGTFTQSAGTHTIGTTSVSAFLYLGYNSGITGTYALSGGTLTMNGPEYVGYNGIGSFTQSGGTNILNGGLYIGENTGSTGNYNLSNGTLTLDAAEYVGTSGAGTMSQSGGSQSVSYLVLGDNPSVTGTFVLNGGTFTSSTDYVGYYGTGIFDQYSGNNIDNGSLDILSNDVVPSSYLLAGGTLTVNNGAEQLAGYFNQTGGVNVIGSTASPQNLYINEMGVGGASSFRLSGGSVTVNGNIVINDGDLEISGGSISTSGTLTVASAASSNAVYLSGGQLSANAISSNPSQFYWTGGTLTVASPVTVGSTASFLGLSLTLTSSMTLNTGSTLINSGNITSNGGTITAAGTITNNGLISGYGTISGPAFTNNANLTLASGFPLQLSEGNLNNNGVVQLNGGNLTGAVTVANTALGTIIGPGQISTSFTNLGTIVVPSGLTNLPAFTNSGAIELASASANLGGGNAITNASIIQGYGTISDPVTNNATIEATGGNLVLTGAVSNSSTGLITAGPGCEVYMLGSNFPANAGSISLYGGVFDNGGGSLGNTGSISGYGTFRAGSWSNSGSMGFSGSLANIYGAVTNTGSITVAGGGTATFYNSVNTSASGAKITIGKASTAVFYGSLTGQSNVTGPGTLDIEGGSAGAAIADIAGNLIVGPAAVVSASNVQSNNALVYGLLTVNPNGTAAEVSTINALAFVGGTLDLKNNDLIVANGSGVGSQIAAAYNHGAWNQPGITSSSAATHTEYNLGYATVGTGAGSLNISSFDGQPVFSGTTAVKYTLNGDFNLDGSVDQNDIAVLAPNYGTSSGATWFQGDVNHDGAVDQNDIALIAPNYGQKANAPGNALTPSLIPGIKTALARKASPSLSGIATPAIHLYTWDAALPDAAAGNVILKVDNTTSDSHFGDVILQGNTATLYTLVITSASGSMNSGRYSSLNAQYAGGGGSETATLQGLAVDNTTNHSGNFSVFSQTANKINEAGLGVTLDFTSNAESVDMSAKANNKNLFSGITADLAFSWSGQNGTLVSGAVEYTTPVTTPEPGMLGMLGVGGLMMARRCRKVSRPSQNF